MQHDNVRYDPRMPSREACVLPYMLEDRVRNTPDGVFVVFEDEEAWSYQRTQEIARRIGNGLRNIGVKREDKVVIWLPNNKLCLGSWFATSYVGAVYVAINTGYKGALLEHVIDNSDAEIMICHPDLADRLLDISRRGRLKTVVTAAEKIASDGARFREAGIDLLPYEVLTQAEAAADLPVSGLEPWSWQAICYTSGTTGPSKAVMSSFLQLCVMGRECMEGLGADDRYIINLPFFHVGGTLFAYGALARGSSIAFLSLFQTDTFLQTCKKLKATACVLVGAMAGFLMGKPPAAADRDHTLRRVMLLPMGDDSQAFAERFGVDVYTVFNMSEISTAIRSELNPTLRGTCGRLRSGVEARIVDENDCEVPVGQVGELVLRTDCPWTMFSGYYKMPEATAKAWRNGWFHTGDAFRVDADGNYFFVDRVKDAIRRRGENISSFEVECEVASFPSVLEVAAVGVPNEVSEEDVLVVVVPKPGTTIDPEVLVSFMEQRASHFMVPRYVRVVDALPKTPTAKVEKHTLRREGVTPDTWDREAAGVRIKRSILA